MPQIGKGSGKTGGVGERGQGTIDWMGVGGKVERNRLGV